MEKKISMGGNGDLDYIKYVREKRNEGLEGKRRGLGET